MLKLIQTADGSNTVYNAEVGENYHSRNGALQESRHVFLQAGLQYFLEQQPVKQVSVLEVGFGTGLNFLLTADFCTDQSISLNYTGIEAFPLNDEMLAATGYDQYITPKLWTDFLGAYQSSLIGKTTINAFTQLHIAHSKLLDFNTIELFDIVYFDAFAATHQPEMWDEAAISHTVKFLKPGGVFVTYAITGNLKRMLKGLGFEIQKIPGAPGKREMLRAIRSADL